MGKIGYKRSETWVTLLEERSYFINFMLGVLSSVQIVCQFFKVLDNFLGKTYIYDVIYMAFFLCIVLVFD